MQLVPDFDNAVTERKYFRTSVEQRVKKQFRYLNPSSRLVSFGCLKQLLAARIE